MRAAVKVITASIVLAGCVSTPPQSEKQRYLNRYTGAQIVAENCFAFGGYGSVSEMRADAEANLAKARAMGATEADIAASRKLVMQQFQGQVFMYGQMPACSSMINGIAWAGTTKAVSNVPSAPPKKPAT